MYKADQKILDQLDKETPHERECLVCKNKFGIGQEDLNLLKKIMVPVPMECPECNHRHRLCFRNEGKMYKRKCDATGKEIVSVYSPDKAYKVYEKDYWHSDTWDALECGQDYNSEKSIFEQVGELMKKVPYPNLMVTSSENCDYVNHGTNDKNCYYVSSGVGCEDCMYGRSIWYSQNCVDCLRIDKSVDCYENVKGVNNNSCIYLLESEDCYDCHFSQNLHNCQNCILSFNLKNKQYYIRNKEVSKQEFDKFKNEWDYYACKEELLRVREELIVRFADIRNSEDCTGDEVYNSRNCHDCFGIEGFDNCRYCLEGIKSLQDSYYMYACGIDAQLQYNSIASGVNAGRAIGCNVVYPNGQDNYYSYLCISVQNVFGCVGLKKKQYCVLNKQYSREEYFELIEKIKLDMLEREEYGEFFPIGLSHFGYNETIANELFPLEKEKAQKMGFGWSDYNPESGYDGPWYEPNGDLNYYRDESHTGELLQGILRCGVTGRPFRVVGPELAFYLKLNIPIPKKSPDQRFADRIALRNPRELWHRQCMCEESGHGHEGRCEEEFETTYAPDREEKVYCEGCYQKSVI
ncbi:hypothetical protein KJ855_03365 [Patescibacteria group bacterium]|nr:hypothetical protein [Patescibacteria group bacterium]